MTVWVQLPDLFNFRQVRAGLYRTDALCGLTDEARERYGELGVHTVIDLRRPEELEAQGRAPEWSYQVWHNVTLREPAWPVGECDDEAGVARYLADIYHGMSQTGGADIARVLSILADPQTGPAVVHCAGGRDRTGVVIALVLALLEVPIEEIALEYALSEEFTRRWIAWKATESGEEPTLPANLLYTPASAMSLFLTELVQRHGSVRDYLIGAGMQARVIDALGERYR